MPDPLDFDRVERWGPRLRSEFRDLLPPNIETVIAASRPEYVEDSRERLFEVADRVDLVNRLSAWIAGQSVLGYHGTRLTDDEVASVRRDGLLPLIPASRAKRLTRSLAAHSKWAAVKSKLSAAIELYGPRNHGGSREGQVHLTVSRAGLLHGFNHYLAQGSEFDWHVAHHLLGEDGQTLVAADGASRLIKVCVPGDVALAACNPFGPFGSNLPNLVSEILKAWSHWLGDPAFRSDTLEVDCGMILYEAVPAAWIIEVATLSQTDLTRCQ